MMTIPKINDTSPTTTNTHPQACAACKYQRRKCAPDCLLAPYFPHDRQRQFLNAHKLFGVSNITKIIRHLDQKNKDEAMNTIIFQSDARTADPVGGCYRIVCDLKRQIHCAQAELDLVLHQLSICRTAAANQTPDIDQMHARLDLDDDRERCGNGLNVEDDCLNNSYDDINYQTDPAVGGDINSIALNDDIGDRLNNSYNDINEQLEAEERGNVLNDVEDKYLNIPQQQQHHEVEEFVVENNYHGVTLQEVNSWGAMQDINYWGTLQEVNSSLFPKQPAAVQKCNNDIKKEANDVSDINAHHRNCSPDQEQNETSDEAISNEDRTTQKELESNTLKHDNDAATMYVLPNTKNSNARS